MSPTRPSTCCSRCKGNGAEPGTPIETCERCGGAGQLQGVTRTPFGQMVRTVICDVCQRRGPCARAALRRVPRPRSRGASARARRGHPGGDLRRPAHQAHRARERRRDAAAPRATSMSWSAVREDERFVREGDDLLTALDVPAPLRCPRRRARGPDARGDDDGRRARGHPARRRAHGRAARACPARARSPRRPARGRERADPAASSQPSRSDLLQELSDSLTEENLRSHESMFAKLRRALGSQAA